MKKACSACDRPAGLFPELVEPLWPAARWKSLRAPSASRAIVAAGRPAGVEAAPPPRAEPDRAAGAASDSVAADDQATAGSETPGVSPDAPDGPGGLAAPPP
ncbi:MAG: hypothetical protein KKG69_03790, partial [Alphaproteobacteria bacterium]|nr:hypothetical protein [Alphaproteobacteria bacterium]MBU2230377.1 hypothetical protein [Alphaproteobacteria bacterium]